MKPPIVNLFVVQLNDWWLFTFEIEIINKKQCLKKRLNPLFLDTTISTINLI